MEYDYGERTAARPSSPPRLILLHDDFELALSLPAPIAVVIPLSLLLRTRQPVRASEATSSHEQGRPVFVALPQAAPLARQQAAPQARRQRQWPLRSA